MPEVYVAIGSNVSPEKHVRDSLTALTCEFGELTSSPVYRTPAVGFEGEDFLNLVVRFNTESSLSDIQDKLRQIGSCRAVPFRLGVLVDPYSCSTRDEPQAAVRHGNGIWKVSINRHNKPP